MQLSLFEIETNNENKNENFLLSTFTNSSNNNLNNANIQDINNLNDEENNNNTLELMEHQKKAIEILEKNKRYGLFYECGLGKTIIALEVIKKQLEEWKKNNEDKKVLVVCPISIIEPAWIGDIKKYYNNSIISPCNLYKINNNEKKIDALKSSLYNLYIINFDGFKILYNNYLKHKNNGRHKIGMLIIDESSKMKNHQSQITINLNAFAKDVKSVYLLSGTPAPNSPLEYYSQIDAISPNLLGYNFWAFREKYFFQKDPKKMPWYWTINLSKKAELMDKIMSVSCSLSKSDVLDLPDKTFITREIMMDKEQIEIYNAYLDILNESIYNNSPDLSSIMKLREITSGFLYCDNEHLEKNVNDNNKDDKNDKKKNYVKQLLLSAIKNKKITKSKDGIDLLVLSDNKFNELEDLVDEIGNKQVIIWINFKYEVEKILSMSKFKGKAVALYSGVPDNEREKNINKFKNGEAQYLIAHPATAGHGLTFTNCSYSIYFSLNYSLELWLQSIDRIHRYGQKNHCTYYILMAKDSIDNIIYNKLKHKQSISSDILNKLKKLPLNSSLSYYDKENNFIPQLCNNKENNNNKEDNDKDNDDFFNKEQITFKYLNNLKK